MKAIYLVLFLSVFIVNCSGENFSTEVQDAIDEVDQDVTTDGDHDDAIICPRYDLVVESVHASNKKLNFKFTFNGEMTFKSTEGTNHVKFNDAKYANCSGAYTNTTLRKNLVPLKASEDLTGEVMISHGQACLTHPRTMTIQVIDSATNTILFSEDTLRGEHGCEFGYTDEGVVLRSLILDLADDVAAAKATACN